jgi:AmmeMemoRadiSam system protein A
MPEAPLTPDEKLALLEIARQGLVAAVRGLPTAEVPVEGLSPRLAAPGTSFVTLTRQGELRGCIGGLQARYPLAEDVRQHTIAAALKDYRFEPVQPYEIEEIEIEISVLNAPEPVITTPPEALPGRLRPSIDGVILVAGPYRATFLPQVWEKIPDPEQFLDTLCNKAGVPAHTWRRGGADIFTYQVESFNET